MSEPLEAGPELDAKLAEGMGWTKWKSPMQPVGTQAFDCWRTHLRSSPTWRISGWRPSREIDHAVLAAEEMRKAGRIEDWCIESPSVGTQAGASVNIGRGSHERFAPTPAHALTLALLAALTGEK